MNKPRVCLVYDCLFPWTIGGVERDFRELAERLAADGHEVTYLTTRQWSHRDKPVIPGVRVIGISGDRPRYVDNRRAIRPAILFGLGVLVHLLRSGHRYDLVHLASFPFFPLLAASIARRRWGFGLVVDWWEYWSRRYWRHYLGPIAGPIGASIQRACLRLDHHPMTASSLHARRLVRAGLKRPPVIRHGFAALPKTLSGCPESDQPPILLFVGRLIPEKRPWLVPEVLAIARRSVPGLRAVMVGDGPERLRVQKAITRLDLDQAVDVHPAVSNNDLHRLFTGAACLLFPSRREGFGLVMLEAIARGAPVIAVAGPENAAAELVVPGVNGWLANQPDADELATLIVRVVAAGETIRASTRDWWDLHRDEFAPEAVYTTVVGVYADALAG